MCLKYEPFSYLKTCAARQFGRNTEIVYVKAQSPVLQVTQLSRTCTCLLLVLRTRRCGSSLSLCYLCLTFRPASRREGTKVALGDLREDVLRFCRNYGNSGLRKLSLDSPFPRAERSLYSVTKQGCGSLGYSDEANREDTESCGAHSRGDVHGAQDEQGNAPRTLGRSVSAVGKQTWSTPACPGSGLWRLSCRLRFSVRKSL